MNNDDTVRRERILGILLLSFLILFTIGDIVEDVGEGSPLHHVIGEGFVICLSLSASIYLWRRVTATWTSKTREIQKQLLVQSEAAAQWKDAHASLLQGLTSAIVEQLREWALSPAETDIALLLIKGLTFKEIAEIRSVSEHTVRQQAATIYRKSGLEGRSQLSAFFLEDLLTTPDSETT